MILPQEQSWLGRILTRGRKIKQAQEPPWAIGTSRMSRINLIRPPMIGIVEPLIAGDFEVSEGILLVFFVLLFKGFLV